MTDGLILEGDISDIILATFLMSLYKDKETGILAFELGGHYKALYIKEGNVVFATSKSPDDRLGESLLRNGKITVKDYIACSKQIRPGKRMGEILVDSVILTPEEMVNGVKTHLIEIIDSIFSHTKGSYRMELSDFSSEDLITLSMEMPSLLYNGMKKVRSWTTTYSLVGPPEQRFKKAAELPQFFSTLDLEPDEEHLFSLTSEGMPVSALLEASYLSQFDTYNLLAIFVTLGLIKKEGSFAKPSQIPQTRNIEELVEDYNDIYSYYFVKLGDGAEETFKAAYDLLKESFVELLDKQEGFYSYGRLDPDIILAGVRIFDEKKKDEAPPRFLEELLYAVAFFAQKRLDKEKIGEVNDYMKKHSSLSHLFKGA